MTNKATSHVPYCPLQNIEMDGDARRSTWPRISPYGLRGIVFHISLCKQYVLLYPFPFNSCNLPCIDLIDIVMHDWAVATLYTQTVSLAERIIKEATEVWNLHAQLDCQTMASSMWTQLGACWLIKCIDRCAIRHALTFTQCPFLPNHSKLAYVLIPHLK